MMLDIKTELRTLSVTSSHKELQIFLHTYVARGTQQPSDHSNDGDDEFNNGYEFRSVTAHLRPGCDLYV